MDYMESDRLFGVYRARVLDVDDPQKKGRLRVSPTTGLGEAMAVWAPALKCAELSAAQVGDTVLVSFERGNPIYPIILGIIEHGGETQT